VWRVFGPADYSRGARSGGTLKGRLGVQARIPGRVEGQIGNAPGNKTRPFWSKSPWSCATAGFGVQPCAMTGGEPGPNLNRPTSRLSSGVLSAELPRLIIHSPGAGGQSMSNCSAIF
jgi:hypothetical protein